MKKLLFFVPLILIFPACEKLIISGSPANTQLNNFNILWEDMDANYGAFTVRDINWDSIKIAIENEINAGMTDPEFFALMGGIIISFKDIHVQLINGIQLKRYNSRNLNDFYAPELKNDYLVNEEKIKNLISFSDIQGTELGYIRIPSFGWESDEYKIIDEILERLKNKKGIILDLRSNSGGQSQNVKTIARRFINNSFVYLKYKLRNGPEHDDYTKWFEDEIHPGGDIQYTRPIALLTNRESASATELFTQTLRGLPHVSVVGDTTAGGLGNNIYRELPNGWTYRFTVWLTADGNGNIFEGRGIPPGFPVLISQQDSIDGIDTQLEKAIELLN